VYYKKFKIEVTDIFTFKSIDDNHAKDKYNAYYKGQKIK
jgi:hypothetical protein